MSYPLQYLLKTYITGASSGFGALAARHTVYAGFFSPDDNTQSAQSDVSTFASANNIRLRSVNLDIISDSSISAGLTKVHSETGGILNTIIHNAGHGSLEAFQRTGTYRMNKICIPHLHRVGKGHVIWISSSSAHGGVLPLLGPCSVAKAATDSLATTIMVPGMFMRGTNHFANAGKLEDGGQTLRGVEKNMQPSTDLVVVAEAIVKVVQAPEGKKPFRVHIDSFRDGSEEVNGLSDRKREGLFDRLELEGLLKRKS
ncbi:SDR family oxidoreductase [Cenococcum geophilum]